MTTDASQFPREARAALHNARLRGALAHLKEGFQLKRAAAFADFPIPFEALREQSLHQIAHFSAEALKRRLRAIPRNQAAGVGCDGQVRIHIDARGAG